MELQLTDLLEVLHGDPTRPRRSEPAMPGIVDRGGTVVQHVRPTGTQVRQMEIAEELFGQMVEDLRTLVDRRLPALQNRLEEAGVPWTPGRGVPRWP